MASTAAVFFDVDFTLIHPGHRFQAAGYQETCARHGLSVDPARFEAAVRGAAEALESADQLYDPALFVNYTGRIIELMGGAGPAVAEAARDLYDAWAEQHHFVLYDDVADSLKALAESGFRLGVISNSHRCLQSFRSHFNLNGVISVTVSSLEHGFLKPHPSIFRAALARARVRADEAAMVGDNFVHDVLGARRVGMRGILLARGGTERPDVDPPVDVIRSLVELPALLEPV
ncbi:MAG TPA: HAD family hydrolase [Vicinamibacterales bacterium]|nr:HAD family hydrolase [Vicinamibacterales bacterium]